jgi:hypothetical protein
MSGQKVIPFTQSKAIMSATEAQIWSSLQANWKGPMSDQDMERVRPLLPSATDTSAQLKIKKERLQELLRLNAKPTPILSSYGVAGSQQAQQQGTDFSQYKRK